MEDEVLESVREIFCFVNQRLSKFCVHYVRAWRDDESGLSRGGGLRNGALRWRFVWSLQASGGEPTSQLQIAPNSWRLRCTPLVPDNCFELPLPSPAAWQKATNRPRN